MALRTWSRVLLTAFGVAALAGAGELGLAYGLGILRFGRQFAAASANEWNSQLAWVAWFAMIAAVVGAVAAVRLAARHEHAVGTGGRIGIAAVAGLGAGVVAPLCMQPARAAELTTAANPVLVAGLAAALGAAVGVFAAVAATGYRLVAISLTASAAAIWALALISVAPSLGPEDALPSIRLGVFDLPSLGDGTADRLAIAGIPVLFILLGAGVTGLARWRGHSLLPAAAAGAAGPALVALAYLVAGPGDSTARGDQMAPYVGSLVAIGAGILGAVLIALLRRSPAPARPAPTGPARPSPIEPTDILQPAPVTAVGSSAGAPSRPEPVTSTYDEPSYGRDSYDDEPSTSSFDSSFSSSSDSSFSSSYDSSFSSSFDKPSSYDSSFSSSFDKPSSYDRPSYDEPTPYDRPASYGSDSSYPTTSSGSGPSSSRRDAGDDQPERSAPPSQPAPPPPPPPAAKSGRQPRAAKPPKPPKPAKAPKPPKPAKPGARERDEDYMGWVQGLSTPAEPDEARRGRDGDDPPVRRTLRPRDTADSRWGHD